MSEPFSPVSVELQEEERQMVLLALAVLSLESPGFDHFINKIACKMDNVRKEDGRAVMYESLRQARSVEPMWGVYDHGRKQWYTHEVPWAGSYEDADRMAGNMDTKDGRYFYEALRLPDHFMERARKFEPIDRPIDNPR